MRALPLGLLLLAACSGTAPLDPGNKTTNRVGGEDAGTETLAASGPESVPQNTFTGAPSGCRDLTATRATADGTQFVVITVDRERLGLEIGASRTIDLGKEPEFVAVEVDVYASAPHGEAYCTDYGEATPARTRWSAEAGALTIELAPDPDPAARAAGSYRATLRLERLHFSRDEGGMAIVVPRIVIEDVRVGWLPG